MGESSWHWITLLEALAILLVGAAIQWGILKRSMAEFEKKMDAVWARFQTLDQHAILAAGHDGEVEARLRICEAAVDVGSKTREEFVAFRAEARIIATNANDSQAETRRSLAGLTSQVRELAKSYFDMQSNYPSNRSAHT